MSNTRPLWLVDEWRREAGPRALLSVLGGALLVAFTTSCGYSNGDSPMIATATFDCQGGVVRGATVELDPSIEGVVDPQVAAEEGLGHTGVGPRRLGVLARSRDHVLFGEVRDGRWETRVTVRRAGGDGWVATSVEACGREGGPAGPSGS